MVNGQLLVIKTGNTLNTWREILQTKSFILLLPGFIRFFAHVPKTV